MLYSADFNLTKYEIKAITRVLKESGYPFEDSLSEDDQDDLSSLQYDDLQSRISENLEYDEYSDETIDKNDYLYRTDKFEKTSDWKNYFQKEEETDQIKRFSYFTKGIYISCMKILGQKKLSYNGYVRKIKEHIDEVIGKISPHDPVAFKIKTLKDAIEREAKKQVFPYHIELIERLSNKFKASFKSSNKPLIEAQSDIMGFIKKGHQKIEKIDDTKYRRSNLRDFLDEILIYLIHTIRNSLKNTSSDRNVAYGQSDQIVKGLINNLESNKIDNYSSLLQKYRQGAANLMDNEQPRFLLRVIRKALPIVEQDKLKKIQLHDKKSDRDITINNFEESTFDKIEKYFDKSRTYSRSRDEDDDESDIRGRPRDFLESEKYREYLKEKLKEEEKKKKRDDRDDKDRSSNRRYQKDKSGDGKKDKDFGNELFGSLNDMTKGIIGSLGKKIQSSIEK